MDNIARYYILKGIEISIVGLRYFNVYGKGEYFKGKTASTILQFGLQLLKGEKVKLFEGSKEIFRDFVYIKDVIQANILAANPKRSGIYNVGTGKARSFYEVAMILQKELGIKRDIEWIKNPYTKQYQFFTQADISDTKRYLGFEPQFSLEDGIKDYLPEIKRIFANIS